MNSIGRVNFVSYDRLVFEITDYNKLQFNSNGRYYTTKGLLDFVTVVSDHNEKYIYQIDQLEEIEKPVIVGANSKFSYQTKVICTPVGMIVNNKINFNMKTYPFLQNKVYLTTDQEFNTIFDIHKTNTINLGLINDKHVAELEINKLLTYHSAILGNTGSGKSTTIRQILSEVNKKKYSNLNIHVFDVHNEYSKVPEASNINVLEEFKISIKELDLQDWVNLVKPSDLVQLPILRLSLKLAYALKEGKIDEIWLKCYLAMTMYNHVQTDAVAKRTKIIHLLTGTNIDTSKYTRFGNFENDNFENNFKQSLEEIMKGIYNNESDEIFLKNILDDSPYEAEIFDDLLKSLNYVFYLEESKGNSQVRVHSTTLEIRIKDLQLRYSKLFENKDIEINQNQVCIYDVSELDDDMLLFFTSYFCKKVLNENRGKELMERDINIFILEEAHRYISKDKEISQMHEIEIYKKIAREGRKFGCFLFLSSQRPSELSGTVLSQCNNYLLHRIKNNVDLEYMSKTIPYIDMNQLKRLSFLPTGTTIAIGELFPISTEIDVYSPAKYLDVTSTPEIR